MSKSRKASTLNKVRSYIREAHKKDSTTADTVSPAADAQARLKDALSFEGSEQEKKIRGFFFQLGIDYDKLTKEEVVMQIKILEKSSLLKGKKKKR